MSGYILEICQDLHLQQSNVMARCLQRAQETADDGTLTPSYKYIEDLRRDNAYVHSLVSNSFVFFPSTIEAILSQITILLSVLLYPPLYVYINVYISF